MKHIPTIAIAVLLFILLITFAWLSIEIKPQIKHRIGRSTEVSFYYEAIPSCQWNVPSLEIKMYQKP